MKYLRTLQLGCLALLLVTAFPRALDAQRVEGKVTWSGGEPVVGAGTTLLDGAFQTVAEGVTDSDGRYHLVAPEAGEFILVVAVEGYPSKMSDPLSLTTTGTVTYDLALPDQRVGEGELSVADTLSDADLLAAAIAESCQGRFMPGFHAILFGLVRDEATGTVIPRADILVRRENPLELKPGSTRLDTQADSDGVYLICTAPAGEEIQVRAISEETEGAWTTEVTQAGTMRRVDLEIPLHNPNEPGSIIGRVRDQEWDHMISGAEVSIKEANIRTETDIRGNFRIPSVSWGQYTLVIDHPSYGHHEQTLTIIGGRSHQLEVYLPPQAIEMDPIIVKVRPRRWYAEMESLQYRIEKGVGYIMTREDIEERQPLHLGDMLRAVPGVDVVQRGSSVSGSFEVRMRNAQNMMGQTCPPVVWVDGIRWRDVSSAFTNIVGSELEVVEVYKGPAEVPGEFMDMNASCGAVIVWTRRGRTFGGG